MRQDSPRYKAATQAPAKRPRMIANIVFDVGSLYLTSHDDISGVPGVVINNCLQNPSVVSQRIVPDQGRSEIGAGSFTAVDLAGAITADLADKLQNDGAGLRRRRVRFYHGYEGFPFSDFQLLNTQVVSRATFEAGAYQIDTSDITREQRKDIFDVAVTTLSVSLAAADTTINANDTSAFTMVAHGTSYTDAPSSTVGYIKIKDTIYRYTGKTSTTFTGCTPVFGTVAVPIPVDPGVSQDRREKITEYVYLELPAAKLLYAVYTGVLHNQGGATLPDKWHLGIDTALVRLSDFTGMGSDIWDPATDTGIMARFEGLTKTDGKGFCERELLLMLSCFPPIGADGALGLRRMNRVLRDSAYTVELNESNSLQIGALEHDMGSLHNVFQVDWNWNGERSTRTNVFFDQASIDTHGEAPVYKLQFKGLHGSRHTDAFIFQLLDMLRDRFGAPPQRMRVGLLHSLNGIEVGDSARVKYATVRDYAGNTLSLDRVMEVQNVSRNERSGRVEVELFGSTTIASVNSPTTPATSLPDAFYTSAGTNLATVLTIVGDVVQPGTYTLNGHADLNNAAAIFYYAGNLTIANGATINITGNVQLRIRGFLQINGTINGQAGGKAGVADSGIGLLITPSPEAAAPAVFGTIAGSPGFVGSSRGRDGVQQQGFDAGVIRVFTAHTIAVSQAQSLHQSAPILNLTVSGSTLSGLPTDLRGAGGPPGGRVYSGFLTTQTVVANGGSGAAGGAGLCVISRGMAFGASGVIDLDGNDSAATTVQNLPGSNQAFPGAGGAGGPGTLYVLLDGSSISVPSIGVSNFFARCGTVPANGFPLEVRTPNKAFGLDKVQQPMAGYEDEGIISGANHFSAAQRIQYIPSAQTPQEDDLRPLAPIADSVSVVPGPGANTVLWAPIPEDRYNVVEVFASITNNRADAVELGEVRGTMFVHNIPAGGLRYYWVRSRDGGFTSDFVPASATAGIPAQAIPWESFEPIPDYNFSRATDQTYWRWQTLGAGITPSIQATGGVDGGVMRIVWSGAGRIDLRAMRVPGFPLAGGDVVKVSARWRRTTAITGWLATQPSPIRLQCGLTDMEDPFAGINNVAFGDTFAGISTIEDINSFPVDEWQNFNFLKRVSSELQGATLLPYLVVVLTAGNGAVASGGTIEIDQIRAHVMADASSAATANTIAARDSNGYLWAQYLNQASSDSENPGISQVLVTNGSDGFLRKASLAHLQSSIGSAFAAASHTHAAGDITSVPSSGVISSGTYTPIFTPITNIDSITAVAAQWMRIGNVGHVSGVASVDSITAGLNTSFRISLPVASNLTLSGHLAGTVCQGNNNRSGPITGDIANNEATLNFLSGSTLALDVAFHFTYLIN